MAWHTPLRPMSKKSLMPWRRAQSRRTLPCSAVLESLAGRDVVDDRLDFCRIKHPVFAPGHEIGDGRWAW